jgi:Zn-dependent protease
MRSVSALVGLFRIHFRIHYSWLLAIILIPIALITQFSPTYPLWQRAVLGLFASLLFFVAIVLREFVINFIAVRRGVVVDSVTLFVFGGLSQVNKETTSPAIELLLATCGQLFNVIVAGVFSVIYFVLVNTENIMVQVLMQWLAFIWFMLAIFHLVPGLPLDGGRALRALLWRLNISYERATRIAAWTGWVIGLAITAGAIVLLFMTRELFTGILLVVAGVLLQNAAINSLRMVRQSPVLNVQLPDS